MSKDQSPTGISSSISPGRSAAPEPLHRPFGRSDSSTVNSPTSIPSTPSRMPLRTNPSITFGTPKKRIVIRSDPTLVTCFDPADKELYDLWVAKP